MSDQQAPPRRLTRSTDDRMVAGVCGGLADYTGIDPVIFRVIVAVATIMGGTGLIAYALAWLVIPEEQDERSHAESLLHERHLPRIGLVGIGIVALIIAGGIRGWGWGHDWGGGGFGLIVVVAIGLWLWSRQEPGGARPPAPPRPAAAPPVPATGTTSAPASRPLVAEAVTAEADVTAPPPPPPPAPPSRSGYPYRRPRERSKLVGITLSVALLVAGLLALADVSAAAVLASCLIVVGAGLVTGSVYGRRRGLIAVGILLTLATASATVADVPVDAGAGDRFWRPTSVASLQRTYELGAGDADLDLRELVLDGTTRHVTVRLGMGDLRIWLPSGVDIEAKAHAGVGEVVLFGAVDHGVDVDRSAQLDGTGGTIVLDARVGFGHLEVNR